MEWRDIPTLENRYKVNDIGEVYSIARKRKLKLYQEPAGYMVFSYAINGSVKTMRVHRAVAMAFIANSKQLKYVNHKNGDKSDNRVDNIEWCTQKENIKHSVKVLKNQHGGGRIVPLDTVQNIVSSYFGSNKTMAQIAKELNLKETTVLSAINNKLKNKATPVENKRKPKGVYYHKATKKWTAIVTENKKSKWLGYYSTIEEALNARNKYLSASV